MSCLDRSAHRCSFGPVRATAADRAVEDRTTSVTASARRGGVGRGGVGRGGFGWGVLLAAALAVLAAACSDPSSHEEQPASQEEPAAVEDAPPAATEAADDGQDGDDDGQPEGPPAAADEPPRAPFPLAEIELTTPGAGVGARPELRWASVDGAASYSVTVYAASGEAWWAWHGRETSVVVGGGPAVAAGEQVADGGPVVRDGMSWDVVALDDDGSLIAHSAVRPLSP